ncbi:MAG: UDP-N-acetyl-D-glucosamine dehydrogenase [Candidatus Omnitrophota bacterium]|nr:MAG: UDP-N-acetyl-D-glucosamine dehydrogenase [Candidatus Omnitrophota bacterium]RKY44612.1 MAG: UDP-N-acetyl-D-glucosamine dehydrogenase [Candidatus Omnitrophota bacterium]
MNNYRRLREKIEKKKAKICIVGLGYVGLPLAEAFAHRGYFVYGLDTNALRIKKLKKGERYIVDVEPQQILFLIKKGKFFPTNEENVLADSDVIIICVPTPLRKVKIPDISYVVKATQTIKNYLRAPQLIILESTSYPTTTRDVVLPILRDSGLKDERDFFLCFSPERVNPGDRKFPLVKIPKIVGGLSHKSATLAKSLYSKIIKKVFVVSSPEVAETSKLLENTFRLVNIALVNEFAILCNRLGVSVWEVIEAAKTKPFGYMPFYPGSGIGGHCIPCDPLYLSWKAKKVGFKTKMIDLASYINRYMPAYVVKRVKELLRSKGISLKNSYVLILGVTYKKDVKDLREAPALDIIEKLRKEGANVAYFDPLIPYIRIPTLNLKRIPLDGKRLRKYDCVVIVTDHSSFNYDFIRRNAKLIFDTRWVYKKNFPNVERL